MEEKLFDCPDCGKKYKHKSALSNHKRLHKELYQCLICDKQFALKSYLRAHKRLHLEKKPHKCPICDKRFRRKTHLSEHELIHTDKMSYQCLMCKKQFKRKSHLKQHKLIHSDDKLYECSECGKGFKQSTSLTNHKLVHLNEKLYQCSMCDKRFKRKCHLSKHETLHPKLGQCTCTYCGKSFIEEKYLLLHSQIHLDKEPYEHTNRVKQFEQKASSQGNTFEEIHTIDNATEKSVKISEHCYISKGYEINQQNEETSIFSVKETAELEPYPVILDSLKIEVEEEKVILGSEQNETKLNNLTCKEELESNETYIRKQIAKFVVMVKQLYPVYNGFNEIGGCDYFKLDVTKQVPLDEQHNNFWEFKCQPLFLDDANIPSKNHTNDSFFKKKKIIWVFKSVKVSVRSIKHDRPYPSFLMPVLKAFEEFIENLSEMHCYYNDYKNQECIRIIIQANSIEEIIGLVIVHREDSFIRDTLQNCFHSRPTTVWNLKSLYYKTTESKAELLYGIEELYETIGGIKIKWNQNNIQFLLNISSVEILWQTIDKYLKPCHETTLLEIGCRNSMVGILLASKCKEVIELDDLSEIQMVQEMCCYNNIKNITFEKDNIRNIELLFERIKNYNKVAIIVHQSTDCGLSDFIMKCLRKLTSISRLVIVTALTEQCFPSLLKLLKPVKDLNNLFIPLCSCIIDTIPGENFFQCVILMERKELSKREPIIKLEPTEEIM